MTHLQVRGQIEHMDIEDRSQTLLVITTMGVYRVQLDSIPLWQREQYRNWNPADAGRKKYGDGNWRAA